MRVGGGFDSATHRETKSMPAETANTTLTTDPVLPVQKQLEAYNAHDIDSSSHAVVGR
jgi:hypothetical protein